MNNLIEYLLNYAFDNKIGYEIRKLDPYFPPRAVLDDNLIIINSNWHNREEIPFTIGHEIGHIMNNDQVEKCQSPTLIYPYELNADKYSLNLIFNYSLDQEIIIQEPGIFIQQYGIPLRMLNYATELFWNNKEKVLL